MNNRQTKIGFWPIFLGACVGIGSIVVLLYALNSSGTSSDSLVANTIGAEDLAGTSTSSESAVLDLPSTEIATTTPESTTASTTATTTESVPEEPVATSTIETTPPAVEPVIVAPSSSSGGSGGSSNSTTEPVIEIASTTATSTPTTTATTTPTTTPAVVESPDTTPEVDSFMFDEDFIVTDITDCLSREMRMLYRSPGQCMREFREQQI